MRFETLESYPALSLAQLNAIAAVRPDFIDSAKKDIAKLIGPKANGLTMLDVITRVVCELPDSDPDLAGLFTLLTKNLPAMNNCILWFFGDDYVADLSLEQAKAAFVELIQFKGTESRVLFSAYKNLQSLRKANPVNAPDLQIAQDDYDSAERAYLQAVHSHAVDKEPGISDGADIEIGHTPEGPSR